jgi:uncharacterized coiled-coil protein SlyX
MTPEEKIIFLENDIEKLNIALYQQDKKIIELEKSLKIIYQKLQEATDNNSLTPSPNEAPPHY